MSNKITLQPSFLSIPSKPLIEVVEDFVVLKPSMHTRRAYRGDLSAFFNQINAVMLEDLATVSFAETVKQVQIYLDRIKKVENTEDRQRVLNAKTVNRKANSLRSFFNYLISAYHYPKNPLALIPNLKTNTHSTTDSLTRAEIRDLLEMARRDHRQSEAGFRNYLIVIFLFVLALRREECANLQWGDLKLSEQTASVYQKGGSIKLLPLPHTVCLLLKDFKLLYLSNCSYVLRPVRNNSHKTVNKPISTSYIFAIIKKLASKVVDKNITPHSLRKTFIEQALDNGEDLISICNATGHSTVEMIKYYDTRDRVKNNAIHSVGRLV